MIGRKRLLITLQPAQVAASGRGYASSAPLKSGVLIDTAIIETDTPSGLVIVNFGVSPGEVASQAAAQTAQSAFDDTGVIIGLGVGQGVPLPNGVCYLTGLGWLIPNSYARLFVEVINNQASDATRCQVVCQGEYVSEQEYYALATGRESVPGAPTGPVAVASGGVRANIPASP